MRNVAPVTIAARLGVAGAVVAMAAALSACGSSGGDAKAEPCPAEDQINAEVKALDTFRFEPAQLSAKAGKFVVRLTQGGSINHNLEIKGAKGKAVVNASTKTACATFTLVPGTYTYVCSVSGHEAAGMKGTLTVS